MPASAPASAPEGHKVHGCGRLMMTRETATRVAAKFREIGGFTRIDVDEFGFETGCYSVCLWSINAAAGSRNLSSVDTEPKTEKEYKMIVKIAKGKASDRDKAAFARMRAEAECNNS